MAVLPLLNISIPGILPTPTYMPGSLALLSLCMVFAALALSYNLLLGTAGMLSFGHALYFGAGAYGLGIVLENTGIPLFPGILIALVGGLVIALVTGAVSMRVSGIPFAMVTLAFAQAGSVLVRRNPQVTGGEEGLGLNTDNVPDWLVGVADTRNLYWFTLVVLVIVYLVVLWVDKSRLGHLPRRRARTSCACACSACVRTPRSSSSSSSRRCSRASPAWPTCCCSRAPCRARCRPI